MIKKLCVFSCFLILLPILAYPIVFYSTIFFFDSPGPVWGPYLLFFAVNAYPAYLIVLFYLARRFQKREKYMPSFLISLSLVATYILFLFFFFLESDTSKLNSEIGNSQISPKDEEFVSSCMNGDIRKVKTMIESGQNVNICLQSGMTPLTLSYRKKKFEVFEILVKFGADINISNIGLQNSPSFYILKNLNPDLDFSYKCFEKILNSGLNVNLSDKNDVLICVASQCSDIRFLMALVAKGANIGVIDGRGDTPIESAIRVMNFDAVQFLLSKGAKYEKEKVVRLIEKLKSKNRMNSKNLRALKKIESRLKIL